MKEDFKDSILVECIIPFDFTTTSEFQTKEVLEELFPGVLEKMYTGYNTELEHIIQSKTVTPTRDGTFDIDHNKEAMLTDTAVQLEERLSLYGLLPEVTKLLQTHRVYRAEFNTIVPEVTFKCQIKNQ